MENKYKLYKLIFAFVSFIAMALVYILLGFVLYKGFSYISLELIFADTNPIDALLLKQRVFDGIFPAIVGTFMLIILALSFSLVFGFAAGIYLSIYAKNSIKNSTDRIDIGLAGTGRADWSFFRISYMTG